MSNEIHRQTIRIKKTTSQRIKALVETGEYLTEAEIIRKCLEIGLNEIENSN